MLNKKARWNTKGRHQPCLCEGVAFAKSRTVLRGYLFCVFLVFFCTKNGLRGKSYLSTVALGLSSKWPNHQLAKAATRVGLGGNWPEWDSGRWRDSSSWTWRERFFVVQQLDLFPVISISLVSRKCEHKSGMGVNNTTHSNSGVHSAQLHHLVIVSCTNSGFFSFLLPCEDLMAP